MLYKDSFFELLAPEKPLVKGHARFKAGGLKDLSPNIFSFLLSSSSVVSSLLFEASGAHGTNIVARLSDDSFLIDVLARSDSDGVNLLWDPLPLSPQELDDIAKKIKDECDLIGVEKPKESSPSGPEPVVIKSDSPSLSSSSSSPDSSSDSGSSSKPSSDSSSQSSSDDYWRREKNYLLRQLDRIP